MQVFYYLKERQVEKRNASHFKWIILTVLINIAILTPVLTIAGSLEPGARPGPTMKTLDEVEARIPIPGSDTAVSVYTISESGSYYLTGDRLCSGTGIQVEADNVTIDLMGYRLMGSGADSGVLMNASSSVEVRNGIISGFNIGVYSSSSNNKGNRVIGIRVMENIQQGISLGSEYNIIKDCTVVSNGTSCNSVVYGIFTSAGSMVSGNTVSNNGQYASSVVYGIYAQSGSTLDNNVVCDNGRSAGSTVYGLYTLVACMVVNNVVYGNGYLCHSNVYGIYSGIGGMVRSNTVSSTGTSANNVYGIHVSSGCSATNNTVYSNGVGSRGAAVGIYLYGNALVDQNTAYSNDTNISACGNCTMGTNHAP